MRRFPLLEVRQRTVLTWQGRLVVCLTLLAICAGSVRGCHAFLAVNAPVEASTLVVQGWLPDFALQEAVAEFHRGRYDVMLVLGGPVEQGAMLAEYKDYATIGVAIVERLGMPRDRIRPIITGRAIRDRTFANAVAMASQLRSSNAMPARIDVVALGPHARRTRLLFEEALGPGISVGVICVNDVRYEPARWWASSSGFRDVTGEAIAWLYARFVFAPFMA